MASVLLSAESGGSEETAEEGAACVSCGEGGPASCARAGPGINNAVIPANARNRRNPAKLPALRKGTAGNAAQASPLSMLENKFTLDGLNAKRSRETRLLEGSSAYPRHSACLAVSHDPSIAANYLTFTNVNYS
jgi:hypothetical protein